VPWQPKDVIVFGCDKCPRTYKHSAAGPQPAEVAHKCLRTRKLEPLKPGVVYERDDS
jgi:hypothetical protein